MLNKTEIPVAQALPVGVMRRCIGMQVQVRVQVQVQAHQMQVDMKP